MMNNSELYRIVSVRKRRKHIAAIAVTPAVSPEELKCERDEKGLILLDFSLAEDGLISENMQFQLEDLSRLIEESYYRKAKSRAVWYLSSADHSEKGLLRKLMRYFPEDASRKAVEKMAELGYIDDEKFARNTCEILSSRGLSDSAMVSKLIAAGVSPALAKETVRNAGNDPAEQIELIIRKKYINKLRDEDSIRRTVNALARRGFSFGDIRAAIRKFTDTEINEEC